MELELYPYDIETYPNCFTAVIGNMRTRKCWIYEISDRKDERKKLFSRIRKIRQEGGYMVGFNSIAFDYPVLHFMLRNPECSVEQIYNKAMEIIGADHEDRFAHMVFENQMIVPQIDLFKIHHFDNVARSTSLKMLEFNMRSDNIEDLPFPVGTHLTGSDRDWETII